MSMDEQENIQQRLQQLRSSRTFSHLSSLADDGSPFASYAPCLVKQEGVYVFLSQLSGHCKNLLKDPRVGVLLIADESDVRNPFARQRVSYQCTATVLEPSTENFDEVLNQLQDLHGKTVELLRQLPDFILFCLQPYSGTYIEGFGKAFELSGEYMTSLKHIDEQTVRGRR